MRTFEDEQERSTPDSSRLVRQVPTGGPAAALLALQGTAGNRAVSAYLTAGTQGTVQRLGSSSSSSEEAPERGGPQNSPDGGSSDGGTTAPLTATIDVRATQISGLGPLPIYHLFVVYTDSAGSPTFYRGGPSSRGGGGGYGNITCTHGAYVPGTIDWAPGAPSTRVMSGTAAVGKDATFVSELSRIDTAAIAYAPTGPNSNSVARTILHTSGVPEEKPVFIAPGWDQIL